MIFVAQNLPVDQYFVENPEELFDGQTDDLVIDLQSDEILEGMVVDTVTSSYPLNDVSSSPSSMCCTRDADFGGRRMLLWSFDEGHM